MDSRDEKRRRFRYSIWALLLFLVWSNSFIAIGYLLGSEKRPAQFDWLSLTVARFVPAALLCSIYCFGFRTRDTLALIRAHWRRLVFCGFLAVPAYNFSLYYSQERGVPAPIASLTTTLAPLFLIVLGILFFKEKITVRRGLGFVVALLGVVVISIAKPEGDGRAHPGFIFLAALAPLSWSLFSVASKPVSHKSPVLWTYLSIVFGTLPLFFVLPLKGGPELLAVDGVGWSLILYLSIGCSVVGFSVWVYLLKHLPASTVGMTVFLNPPLTTASKRIVAWLLPSSFGFGILPLEWVGGAIVLIGLAVSLVGGPRRRGGSGSEGGEGNSAERGAYRREARPFVEGS